MEKERKHRLVLSIEGEPVGFAELVYFSRPFPMYYLDYMQINRSFRGSGYGSQLIEQVNAFIAGKKKAGALINAIEETSPARGIYAQHGWEQTPIPDLMIFRRPADFDENQLRRVLRRILDWDRKTAIPEEVIRQWEKEKAA